MSAYASIRAINWSSLKHIAVSPKLYRRRLENPQPRTAAFTIGGAIHCLLFEPGQFDSRYAVYDGTRRGKDWDSWIADHPGVESLKPPEMERVQRSADAVRSDPDASPLIQQCRVEEVTTWQDPETGLACKGRLDAIGPRFILDLKGAADIVPRRFIRSAAEYLYHGQLAFYHDGATIARKIAGDELPYLVSVENDEPYDVVTYQMLPQHLVAGRTAYRMLLQRLSQCIASDWWPGVAPGIQPYDIPPYALGASEQPQTEDF